MQKRQHPFGKGGVSFAQRQEFLYTSNDKREPPRVSKEILARSGRDEHPTRILPTLEHEDTTWSRVAFVVCVEFGRSLAPMKYWRLAEFCSSNLLVSPYRTHGSVRGVAETHLRSQEGAPPLLHNLGSVRGAVARSTDHSEAVPWAAYQEIAYLLKLSA